MRNIGIDIDTNDKIYDNIHDFDYICQYIFNKGIGKSKSDVKNTLFKPGGELYYEVPVFSTSECIKIIKAAGGKVVLAHPGRINVSMKELELIINDLTNLGIDGIECYHPDNNEEIKKMIIKIAREKNLFLTGGSDLHGSESSYRVTKDSIYNFVEKS